LSRVIDIIFITWWIISLISVLRTYPSSKRSEKGIEDSAAGFYDARKINGNESIIQGIILKDI
jgi:hypothetical protein